MAWEGNAAAGLDPCRYILHRRRQRLHEMQQKVARTAPSQRASWWCSHQAHSQADHPISCSPRTPLQVVVFSWSGCPFCKQAKSVLDGTGAKYTALELDQMADGDAIRAELAKLTDRTSVPNIFIAGKPPRWPCVWAPCCAGRLAAHGWCRRRTAPGCRVNPMLGLAPTAVPAGKSVGGCNDGPGVATLQKKGELVPMLQAAGAL